MTIYTGGKRGPAYFEPAGDLGGHLGSRSHMKIRFAFTVQQSAIRRMHGLTLHDAYCLLNLGTKPRLVQHDPVGLCGCGPKRGGGVNLAAGWPEKAAAEANASVLTFYLLL